MIHILWPDGPPSNLRDWGLVMSAEAAAILVQRQDEARIRRFRADPFPLSDGRYALPAGILADMHPRGLYSTPLVSESEASMVEVVPWTTVLELLPPPPEEML